MMNQPMIACVVCWVVHSYNAFIVFRHVQVVTNYDDAHQDLLDVLKIHLQTSTVRLMWIEINKETRIPDELMDDLSTPNPHLSILP
jgi:hypothetical protein